MIRSLLILAVSIASLAVETSAAEPFRIRVLCYNIHHGEGVDGKLDLPRIAKVIQSVSPDVVALQEVDRKTERTGRIDQPAELARLTNMEVVFEKNIDFEGGQYGNAVLSNLPVVSQKNVHLPSLDDGEQRGVLICELKPKPLEESILLLCTHLDHRAKDQERLASAQQINELIAERGDRPAILAGDLNASRDSRVLAAFTKQWQIANKDDLPTVPVGKPQRQIDFILSRPNDRWKAVEVRVLDEAIASDHRAIFAVLELQPGPGKKQSRNDVDQSQQSPIDSLKEFTQLGPCSTEIESHRRQRALVAAAAAPQGPAAPLLEDCLDYGRSFINTKADFNAPRFWVESRCRIVDKQTGKTVEYLQCGLCKAENTFAERDLFQEDNYDFLPVFSEAEGVVFRRKVRAGERYREVRPNDQWWGGTEPRLKKVRGRLLTSPDEIFAAMKSGKPIVGQTEIRDENTGRTAVIEYPVKTMNFRRSSKDWQVDTGPIVLPDLSSPADQLSQTLRLAHIAFRTSDWADFLVDQATPVNPDDQASEKTWHYSQRLTKSCRNVLLVWEDE